MRRLAYLFFITALALNISCKNQSKKPDTDNGIIDDNLKENTFELASNCYLYAVKKDSIKLKISTKNDSINGLLNFNFFEKDGSFGSFKGIMKGDTLRGIYNFEAEGTQSKREMAFLKKGNVLMMGSGEPEMINGVEKFKGKVNYDLENAVRLHAIDCDDIHLY